MRRGEVLATLDCRNATTASSAIALQARAIEAQQKALEDESSRTQKLLSGGYASTNEAEQALAHSAAEAARLEAEKAKLAHSSLEVSDCVLRAPFEGEVGERFVDPGAFVHPGTPVVSVIDRSTVRFVADVPEVDFAVVAPKTPVRIHADASGIDLTGTISRRSPHADAQVRTIHFEVDLADPDRSLPVDTTGEAQIDVGQPTPAFTVPLLAATVRGAKATVFTVEGEHAHAQTLAVLGEHGSTLFLDRALKPGAQVITEGRALLSDGDLVAAREEPPRHRDGRFEWRPAMTLLSLRNPVAVLMICLGLVVFALVVTPRMSVDTFPELTPPVLQIGEVAPGLAAKDVEKAVAWRIERYVAATPGVDHVESLSRNNFALIYVWLKWGTDLTAAQTLVQSEAAFAMAGAPKSLGLLPPFVLPYDPSNAPVCQVVITGAGYTARNCTTTPRTTSSPRSRGSMVWAVPPWTAAAAARSTWWWTR